MFYAAIHSLRDDYTLGLLRSALYLAFPSIFTFCTEERKLSPRQALIPAVQRTLATTSFERSEDSGLLGEIAADANLPAPAASWNAAGNLTRNPACMKLSERIGASCSEDSGPKCPSSGNLTYEKEICEIGTPKNRKATRR
jgi:hypothetical protein